MVLEHIADRADLVVERTPIGDVERLGHRDLDGRHVLGTPDRFQEPVGEAEVDQVLDGFLAQEVVDAKDARLVEDTMQRVVEPPRPGQVAPEGFLHDDPRAVGTVRLAEQPDDGAEQRRRDRQVVEGMRRGAEFRPEPAERVGIVVRAGDEAELLLELPQHGPIDVALRLEAVAGALAQAGKVAVPGDADDGHRPARVADEAGKGREDLLERQIAGRAEEDEGVGRIGRRPAPRRSTSHHGPAPYGTMIRCASLSRPGRCRAAQPAGPARRSLSRAVASRPGPGRGPTTPVPRRPGRASS